MVQVLCCLRWLWLNVQGAPKWCNPMKMLLNIVYWIHRIKKRLQWILIIVQKKAEENRVWKKVKIVTLFCFYLHTKLTYLSAARVDGLLMLIRVELMLRAVYFSEQIQGQFMEKATVIFGKIILLPSWTCSPPNCRILKQQKEDTYAAMIVEEVFNVSFSFLTHQIHRESVDKLHSHGLLIVLADESLNPRFESTTYYYYEE